MLQDPEDQSYQDSLVKEAALGHVDTVKDILAKHPEHVSIQSAPIS